MDKKPEGLKDFMKDFEIKIEDEGLRKTLGKVLCEEIADSIKANADAYTLFKQCEHQYLGNSKWKQLGQKKNKPWLDSCDFWAPVSEWIICAIAARVDSILFAVEPMMTAFAVESSDVPGEADITDFADVVMTKIVELREKFKFYVKQKVKQPLSVAAYEWQYEEDLVREVEHGVVQPDFSIKLDSGKITPPDELPQDIQDEITSGQLMPGAEAYFYVERDKPMLNQPVFTPFSPEDYVWTHGTKKGEKPYLEGYRFWQTIGQVRKKQKNEEYWEYDEIKSALEKAISEKVSSADMARRVITERSHPFECFRVFTRLPFNDEGDLALDDPKAEEQEIVAEVAYKEQVILKLHKWHYLRDPFKQRVFLYGWYEEKDTMIGDTPFLGRSMSEKISEINLLINKEFQQIVDNADLAMCKIFTKRRQMLVSEDYEEPEVFPGAFWEVDEVGDIGVLEVGDVKRIGFEIMDQLQNFAVRISNISAMNVSSRMEGGKPLATEVISILKEGEIGREGFIQSCHEDLRFVYRWTMDYYFQFMPEGLEKRIRGENKQLMFPQAPNEQQFIDPQSGQLNQAAYEQAVDNFEKKKYYTRDMLVGVGKWDFKWNGTQLSGDREWQIQVSDYLAKVLPQFVSGGFVTMTAVWELLRDILISRGKKDWQKYLAPRELFEQMDNQKMAKQQMLLNLPQIRQQMIDQGMDPQLVSATMAKLEMSLGGGQNVPPTGQPAGPAPGPGKAQPKAVNQ